MIVEHRVYTFHPGKMGEFWRVYRPEPLALQRRILGNLLGYFTVEAGALNQVIHLWGYESFEDRLRRRAQLMTEPVWLAYIAAVSPLLQRQESQILLPTDFSPIP